MRNLFMAVLGLLLFGIIAVYAQEAPPAGYNDSCEATPILYAYFGPNCLNPVTWDLPGFIPIDRWVFFTRDNDTTDAGVVKGYTWDRFEGRYRYWVMVQMPYEGFGGSFEDIDPTRIVEYQQLETP